MTGKPAKAAKAAKEALKAYIERIERIDEERKALGDDRRLVLAEAKAEGFDPAAIRRMIKRRKTDANDLAEAEAIDATYMHALGMAGDVPLCDQVKALAQDGLGRDQLIEAFQLLIPTNGEIIARVGGQPMRLWRNEDGEPHAEEYAPPAPAAATAPRPGRDLDSEAVEATVDGARKSHVISAADRAERRARGLAK